MQKETSENQEQVSLARGVVQSRFPFSAPLFFERSIILAHSRSIQFAWPIEQPDDIRRIYLLPRWPVGGTTVSLMSRPKMAVIIFN